MILSCLIAFIKMSPSIINGSLCLIPEYTPIFDRIRIISKNEFILSNSSYQEANRLRKAYYSISTNRIDEVIIIKNESDLHNEILAHRLGMIPIDEQIKEVQKNFVGPITINSQEIGSPILNIIVVVLRDNQRLEIKLQTSSGTGSDHAKFMPPYDISYSCQSSTVFLFKVDGIYSSIYDVISAGLKHM